MCGITDPEDARAAVDLGAWALGLIFWGGSSRGCPADAAEHIGATMRRQAELTGVFVNATLDEIALAADRYGLSLVQLHGDEGPSYAREVARRTGCRVIKSMAVRDAASVRDLEAFHTDFHLLDASMPGERGGTGTTFNWELASAHRGAVPLLLSGGLDADNVGEGIRVTRPYAVDVATGTERCAGHKDPAKLKAFFRAVHAIDTELSPPARDAEEATA
ncbi:MAG: phosphoribosylanthranilate isomerase [Thermoleophilaceae bacterium]